MPPQTVWWLHRYRRDSGYYYLFALLSLQRQISKVEMPRDLSTTRLSPTLLACRSSRGLT